MGNYFVLFYVFIVIPHGRFHCGNRGYTQNTDFPSVKSHFPVGKRSSGTATIVMWLNEVCKQTTFRDVKRDNGCSKNTATAS